MRTHKRICPWHKAFNVTKDEAIVSKNVTMKCFVAQNKLPSHVEAQNTKSSGLLHDCTPFQKRFNFVRIKSASLKQFKP